MRGRGGRGARPSGLWHEGFYDLIRERGAAGFEHTVEHVLSTRPRRADLLLRRTGVDTGEARTLRGLWPHLGYITLLELKSPSRGFRRGDLVRLVSYGAQYHAEHLAHLAGAHAFTLVLVTPRLTQTLRDELSSMAWQVEPLGDGYARVHGPMYTTFIALTNEVAEAENDDMLRIFSERGIQTHEAMRWLEIFFLEKHPMADLNDYEARDELLQKFLDSLPPDARLRGIPPAERLRGIPPAERLRGIPPEETLLALPDEVLRGLPAQYIRTLPEHVQRTIRARLARSR